MDYGTGRRIAVLVICCSAVLVAGLDTTALNVALPAISRDLHSDIAGAQWTIASYTLVLACLLTFSGALGDRIGRRTVFQIGLGIFAAGSLACSLAPSLGWLVGFRMVQAVGGSMLSPAAMAIVTHVFAQPADRVRALGIWSGAYGVSIAAGPCLGGLLVDGIGWEAVFWINVPICLAALVATAVFVPQSRADRARRLDPPGQLLVIGFLGLLIFAIIEAPHRGWGSPMVVGAFAGSAVCLALLIRQELRTPEPLVDVRAFRSPKLSGATVIAVLAYFALGGFLFLNTFYLQEVRGDRPVIAGLELLPMAAAMVVGGPVAGRLVARWGTRFTLQVGTVVAAAASILLTFTFDTGGQIPLLLGYALFGAGIGIVNPPITNAAVSGLPAAQSGVASSLASTSRQVGQCLGVAVIGSVVAGYSGALASAEAFHRPATLSWLTMSAVLVAAFVVARAITRR